MDSRVRTNSLVGLYVNMGSKSVSTQVGKEVKSETIDLSHLSILSNTNESIVVDIEKLPQAATVITSGDSFVIEGDMIRSVSGFDNRLTSADSGHYHEANVVGDVITGTLDSITDMGASYVTFRVIETSNFDIELVQRKSNLLKDAQIRFRTETSPLITYSTRIVEHTADTIKVLTGTDSMWNSITFDPSKVSSGWHFEIESQNYGYTTSTVYSDFVLKGEALDVDISRGVSLIPMDSTGVSVGDKIRIQDDSGSFVNNIVDAIPDTTHVHLYTPLTRTFYVQKNATVYVFTDVFGEIHEHQIRRGELEVIRVPSYLDHGYSSEHTHLSMPMIASINAMVSSGATIYAAGSGSIIYNSLDGGNEWRKVIDLNDYVDGVEDIESVSAVSSTSDGNVLIGTSNGLVFVKNVITGNITRLIQPKV
jgi:hypothetical protein